MSCHSGISFKLLLYEYHQAASASYDELPFPKWLEDNYSFRLAEAKNESPSGSQKTMSDTSGYTDLDILKEIANMSSGQVRLELDALCGNSITEQYANYAAASMRGDPLNFAQYASSELKLTHEPSQSIFSIFRKQTPEEKARAEELKAVKKKAQEEKREARQRTQHELEKLEIEKKAKQEVLNKEKERILGSELKKREIEKIRADIEAVKKSDPENATSPGEAKTDKLPIYLWDESDAHLIYRAVFNPEQLTLKQMGRYTELIDRLIVDNHFLKTQFESIKSNRGVVNSYQISKLLSVVKAYPDTWGTGKSSVPKTLYIGSSTDWANVDSFTLSDCHDIYLSLEAMCKGSGFQDLTSPPVKEVKESRFTKLKNVLKPESKTTVEWDDRVVAALYSKMSDKNPSIDVVVLNKLGDFVKKVCSNKRVNQIKNLIQKYLSKHKIPPVAGAGVVIVLSTCKFKPTRSSNGQAITEYSDSAEKNELTSMSESEVNSLSNTDKIMAYNAYLKMVSLKNSEFVLQPHGSDQSEPASVKMVQGTGDLGEVVPYYSALGDCLSEVESSFSNNDTRIRRVNLQSVIDAIDDSPESLNTVREAQTVLKCYLQYLESKIYREDISDIGVTEKVK